MILTEKEAKTKRCQESFPASDGVSSGDAIMSSVYVATTNSNLYGVGAMSVRTASAPLHCIGSACMAWRFTGDTNEFAAPLGYCGKAGAP